LLQHRSNHATKHPLKVMEYNLTKHQTLRDIWDVGLLLL
jgi:hypothetical protein